MLACGLIAGLWRHTGREGPAAHGHDPALPTRGRAPDWARAAVPASAERLGCRRLHDAPRYTRAGPRRAVRRQPRGAAGSRDRDARAAEARGRAPATRRLFRRSGDARSDRDRVPPPGDAPNRRWTLFCLGSAAHTHADRVVHRRTRARVRGRPSASRLAAIGPADIRCRDRARGRSARAAAHALHIPASSLRRDCDERARQRSALADTRDLLHEPADRRARHHDRERRAACDPPLAARVALRSAVDHRRLHAGARQPADARRIDRRPPRPQAHLPDRAHHLRVRFGAVRRRAESRRAHRRARVPGARRCDAQPGCALDRAQRVRQSARASAGDRRYGAR